MKKIQVVVAIIEREGKVFVAKRNYGKLAGYWEFPGGKLKPGETAPQALVREIQEELHAQIEVKDHFAQVEYDYPDFHLSMDCYIAKLVSDVIELSVHSECKWVDASHIEELRWLEANGELVQQVKRWLDSLYSLS